MSEQTNLSVKYREFALERTVYIEKYFLHTALGCSPFEKLTGKRRLWSTYEYLVVRRSLPMTNQYQQLTLPYNLVCYWDVMVTGHTLWSYYPQHEL